VNPRADGSRGFEQRATDWALAGEVSRAAVEDQIGTGYHDRYRMRRSSSLLALLLASACASSPVVHDAQRGDFAALRADVTPREHAGTLSNREAADIARAVARWELTLSPKDEQLAHVREVRACAFELDGSLADREETHDAAGAEAALARVESGSVGAGSAREHLGDADDAWRAVGARGLVRRDDDARARARAFVDPAPAVRRAALHAAAIARDPLDVEHLAEVARLDPDPVVRTDATRALGAIGGPLAFAKLRDLWSAVDEPQREDVAAAYAAGPTWDAGGKEELRVVLAAAHGPAAIEGAGAVLRGPSRDAAIDSAASALLARTIWSGPLHGETSGTPSSKASRRDRLHAVAVVPSTVAALRPAILDALRAASKDDDVVVRVAVLARLTSSPPDRAAAVEALEGLAAPDAGPARAPTASRARLALAEAGDLRVQSWVESDLVAHDAATRLAAATALAALGRAGRAAPLLADDDPGVRTRAACTVLLGARSR
jgi:HEAT repeat protein